MPPPKPNQMLPGSKPASNAAMQPAAPATVAAPDLRAKQDLVEAQREDQARIMHRLCAGASERIPRLDRAMRAPPPPPEVALPQAQAPAPPTLPPPPQLPASPALTELDVTEFVGWYSGDAAVSGGVEPEQWAWVRGGDHDR